MDFTGKVMKTWAMVEQGVMKKDKGLRRFCELAIRFLETLSQKIEFGAKVSLSLIEGISFIDRINWNAYSESGDLKTQIDHYRKRFRHYPEFVHADKIYRTQDNHSYCEDKEIRLSSPVLGRQKTDR